MKSSSSDSSDLPVDDDVGVRLGLSDTASLPSFVGSLVLELVGVGVGVVVEVVEGLGAVIVGTAGALETTLADPENTTSTPDSAGLSRGVASPAVEIAVTVVPAVEELAAEVLDGDGDLDTEVAVAVDADWLDPTGTVGWLTRTVTFPALLLCRGL